MSSISFLDPVVSICDPVISEFLRKSIINFKDELEFYIQENNDPVILSYSNEQTLASIFVNGLIRNDLKKEITALQEYSTFDEDSATHKRPDIFIRYNRKAIWIECKMDRNFLITDDHWDIGNWLEWDYNHVFKQANIYYNAEKKSLNSTYDSGHYVMTLVFKLIKENPDSFINKGKMELVPKIEESCDRPWFYSSLFILDGHSDSGNIGIEIYGTIRHMNP